MIEIFDADCGCLGVAKGSKAPVGADELLRSMDRLQIERALVRYAPLELGGAFAERNDAVFELCSRHDRLCACPAAVPATGFDAPEEALQIAALIDRGAAAVTVCPAHDCWLPEPFVCDRLFAALRDRRMPVLTPANALPLEKTAALAARFKELPFILTGLHYRAARSVNALLDACDNVYVSLGHNYAIQGIVEAMTARYGAGRFVLGAGFPEADPAGAVTQLMYARISEADKQAIGRGVLDRLIGGVRP